VSESNKINLKNLTKEQLENFVRDQGLESFRSRQLFHWIYQKNVSDFSEMSTLKNSVRDSLKDVAEINLLKIAKIVTSKLDSTKKFLFELSDGKMIESVYMEDADRKTICVSSQVGCALKCDFCATGKMGFQRNLTSGEIVEQVLCIERYIGEEATNIVVMGMGEPFLNYDAVLQSADLFSDPEGIAISKRKITISTSGIIPGIQEFTQEKRRFKLAISLNATTDDVRSKLMPISKKYHLNELLEAVKNHTNQAPYRVTFEYLLIAGINDFLEDANRLKVLLKNIPCKINLIPYNSISSNYSSISDKKINQFLNILSTFSAPITVRRSKGQDIQAACGQLYTDVFNK